MNSKHAVALPMVRARPSPAAAAARVQAAKAKLQVRYRSFLEEGIQEYAALEAHESAPMQEVAELPMNGGQKPSRFQAKKQEKESVHCGLLDRVCMAACQRAAAPSDEATAREAREVRA